MTATSFESARPETPHDASGFERVLAGLATAAPFDLHLFAETYDGQLISRFMVGNIDSEASYRIIRLVEGHLADVAGPAVLQVPHGIPGLEGRVLVVTVVAHLGRTIGVAVGSTHQPLGDEHTAALVAAADGAGEPVAHLLERIRLAARDDVTRVSLEISRTLAESSQLPKLIPVVARAAAAAAGFERGTLLLWRPDGELSAGASEFATGQPDIRLWGVFRAMDTPVAAIGEVLATGETSAFEVAEEVAELEPERWVRPFGIKSVLLVPLVDRGECIGVIVLDSEARIRIDRDRIEAAKRVAEHGAITIGVARTIQRERSFRQRTQLVLGTVVQAATQMNTSGVLTVIAEGINAVLSDATTIAFVLQEGRASRLAVCGRGDGAVDLMEALLDRSSYAGEESPFTNRFVGPIQLNAGDGKVPVLREMGIGRVLVVPVRRAARDLGWVISYDRSPSAYLEDDLKVVAGIAAQAALSLHTATLLEGERATVARLEELDRLKTAFVAAVSHELRTPLTAIVGFSEILAEQISDSVMVDFLEDMRREAAVLEALIGNLLDTSRLEAGMLQLNLQAYDIGDVVVGAADVVGHGYKDREIRIDIEEGLHPIIVDQVRLRQVLVNLLENAAKYSPPGAPIDVHVAVRSGTHRMLEIRVEDAGNGIPPEHREAVFQRFHRLSTHQSKPGTGIGLYLVKALVEAHGGTISIGDRRDGHPGASFAVFLPMSPAEVPVGG